MYCTCIAPKKLYVLHRTTMYNLYMYVTHYNIAFLFEDNEEVSDSGNDLDEDVAIALTEKETEIRSYLIQGEQLQEEHLEELVTPFWTNEPYKSV